MSDSLYSCRYAVRLFILVWSALHLSFATQTHAATITVTNTNDSGPGSLRQALMIAHDGDTITFAVTGTIVLTSGGLPVNKNVTISGAGPDQLSIDGNQALLVFGIFPDKTATISGLTIRDAQFGVLNEQGTLAVNNCTVTGNSEVGVYNDGTLNIGNCIITLNSFGLSNDHAEVTVSNCVITANSNGGIYNSGSHGPAQLFERRTNHRDVKNMNTDCFFGACLTVESSIISDNSGPAVSNSGSAVILNSTLSGNSAGSAYSGGGINTGDVKNPGSSATIINSTISGNSASEGGGISNCYGLLTVENSTISSNSAKYQGGGIGNCGGVELANSTLSGNSAPAGFGGGIVNGGAVEIRNTIFNAGAPGENIVNNGGTVTSQGYNISSDDGGGVLTGPGDQINTDPLLGPLQDNGGPTFTHLPLPGSPAIDAGDPSFTRPPYHDQRGACFYRVFGRRIDVGSVETQPRPRCVTPEPRQSP
jgi:hypothetical protein